jgi:hypothetical protein
MSSVVIAGDTSGTVTLDAPAVAGSTVITLPATSGAVLTSATPFSNGQGPAFSAESIGDQTVSFSTLTKINITSEIFDTNSNYDTANSRFTPTVAGYYQVNGALSGLGSTTLTRALVLLYKNGTEYSRGVNIAATLSNTTPAIVTTSEIVYMNGSTDYIELYGFLTGSGTATFEDASGSKSRFSAVLVRGA